MSWYDEINNLVDEKAKYKMWSNVNEIIIEKSKNLTNVQFKYYLILSLAIWDDNFVNNYFKRIIERNELTQDQMEMVISLLRTKLIND